MVDTMVATTAFRRHCGNVEMESYTPRTQEEPEKAVGRRNNQYLD